MIAKNWSGEPAFAMKSDGTKIPLELGKGYNLANGTWYIDVSSPDGRVEGIHMRWDSSFVASAINFEDTCFPAFTAPDQATADVSLNDADAGSTLGNWVKEDPSSGVYIPTGTGYTVTNMTIAVTGGTANGTMINLGNYGGRRGRLRIVVTTPGFIRVATCAR